MTPALPTFHARRKFTNPVSGVRLILSFHRESATPGGHRACSRLAPIPCTTKRHTTLSVCGRCGRGALTTRTTAAGECARARPASTIASIRPRAECDDELAHNFSVAGTNGVGHAGDRRYDEWRRLRRKVVRSDRSDAKPRADVLEHPA